MMQDVSELAVNEFLGHAELLAQLASHPAWEGWTGLLRDMRQTALEELARSNPDTFRYWQGVVSALGDILDRPSQIIASAADYQRNEEAEKHTIRTELRGAIGMGIDRDGSF